MMPPDLFALTQDTDGRTDVVRRVIVSIFLLVILLQPAARLLIGPRTGLEWFQLAGALTLTGIVLWQVTSARDIRRRTEWLGLALAIVRLSSAAPAGSPLRPLRLRSPRPGPPWPVPDWPGWLSASARSAVISPPALSTDEDSSCG
jgi:hypothetical protein